jgi:outer membrane lipoprotein-sorting protein
MRSPVSCVAASVIFVVAMTGVVWWFHAGGATPGFADFLKPILEAKGVKYKMTVEMESTPAMTTTSDVMILDSAHVRYEMTMPDGSKTVMIRDSSQGKGLDLFPAMKKATVLTFANCPKDKSPVNVDPLAGYRLLLLDARDNPNVKRKPLGEKVIEGRRVIGFQINTEDGDTVLWGDPKTGLPVRIQVTRGMDRNVKVTMSDVVFDTDIDKSLFSIEPPAGYTVRNEKMDGSPHEENDLIEAFRECARLSRGAFPKSLDMRAVSFMVWKKLNSQMMLSNLSLGMGNGRALEAQRDKIEAMIDEFTDKIYDNVVTGKVSQKNQEANQEPLRRFQEQMRKIVIPMTIRGLWEKLAPTKLVDNEKQWRRFETRMRKIMEAYAEGKPDKEQTRIFGEESGKLMSDLLWEDIAPAEWKANEQRKRQFQALMLKRSPAKPKEKQRINEEIRKAFGAPMLKAVEAWDAELERRTKDQAAQAKKSAKDRAAESLEFMEAQVRVQRGVMFANELPPTADAHYVGKGVSLGAADKPIFWYRPKDAKKYRVIYADLSIREADAPPNVPNAQPVPAKPSPTK